jgi:hypothetical protein
VCGLGSSPAGFLGRERTSSTRPGDLFERHRWEHGAHLRVAGLMALDTSDGPTSPEQPRVARVDSTVPTVEGLDLAVPTRDDREAFVVQRDAQPKRRGEFA